MAELFQDNLRISPAVTWEAAALFGKVNVIVIEQSGSQNTLQAVDWNYQKKQRNW